MAAKDSNNKSSRKANFRTLGKYFLLLAMIVGQGLLGYFVIEKNYAEIYDFVYGLNTEEPGTYQLDELVVNPAHAESKSYLLIQLTLELVTKDEIELVKKHESKIKNDLIEYLSSQSVSNLEGAKSKDQLRLELIKLVNNAVGIRSVRNLYYSKYVMQ